MSGEKPTLDQRRAYHAWQAVQRAKNKVGKHSAQDPRQFRRQAKKLPLRILTSGLGQSLTFLKTKKGKEEDVPGLLAELSNWVLIERLGVTGTPIDLLEFIIAGGADDLRRATEEVMVYLQWLNRFCEAEIEDDEETC